MSNAQEVMILLVEDDPGHARLIEKNLRRAYITNPIRVFRDGQQVIDYLFSPDQVAAQEPLAPALMLLDLNLPVLNGYQVLERVKRDARTKRIPVIILTTTDDTRELSHCYDLGCSVCITKPVEYEAFSEAIRKLGFFLSVVTIPEVV